MMGIASDVENTWDTVMSPLFEELSTEVQVQTVDVNATPRDPLYDEPDTAPVFTGSVSIHARVKLERDRLVLPGGEDVEIDGRVTMRTDELAVKGVVLDPGARIVFQGTRYTVVHLESRGQTGGRFLLTRAAIRREN